MTAAQKSCAVALPIQRNCATPANDATLSATGTHQNPRKPASIRELRAQLKAQQYRNQAETVTATAASKVAHDPPVSCAVALPKERNRATDLIAEFMEVDGLSLAEATQLAADCANIRPAHEWLAMIKELDALIGQFCERFKLDDAAKERILEVRSRQSLFSIAHSLDWFRNELKSS
ncbi:hypothetical protein [Herbaspirillum sp. ST 5-3]|uniref:hypothetical protein n=1 Tax=Oxalobacteraceae TaxID=75682 RepID=UPI0010A4E4E9|nr:hypothetical protein [Herbaspirillum sp. ST 5-3]